MGIDHGVANLERHVSGTPSVAIQSNTGTSASEWRFRRSERISGLDNAPRAVHDPRGAPRYSQVGAVLRGGRNTGVTARPTR
ncbi:hypothetical protein E0L36_20235 [Streptomyces sp. AJS327]|nr:hypothetical protein [Streptomyces sp. AJS327]